MNENSDETLKALFPFAKTRVVAVVAFFPPLFSSYCLSLPSTPLPCPPSIHPQRLYRDNPDLNPSFHEFVDSWEKQAAYKHAEAIVG